MTKVQEETTQREIQDIKIGKKFSLTSEVLGEERSYLVHLPFSYHDNTLAPQRYPVLYLLDGDESFLFASGVVQCMSMSIQIPELIIVAISNTNRIRDFTPTHSKIDLEGNEVDYLKDTGGGNNFLRFIQDELFPEIESSYRTLNFSIFAGHSAGGIIVLHSLLDAPDMFQGYIATDPGLLFDNQELVRRVESVVKDNGNLHGAVYISTANTPELGFIGSVKTNEACRAFANSLASVASPGFRSTLEYFEAEDHSSIPLPSLYHGLLYIFDGYKPLLNDLFYQPSALKTHFKRISEQLGVALLPPEGTVRQMGYHLLYYTQAVDAAIELFKLNVSNYPKSYNVYDSLGEAYRIKGEKKLAIENFEKSLELNSANENAKQRLQALKNNEKQK